MKTKGQQIEITGQKGEKCLDPQRHLWATEHTNELLSSRFPSQQTRLRPWSSQHSVAEAQRFQTSLDIMGMWGNY